METPISTVSPEKLLYDQWRTNNLLDPTAAQNTVHLGPNLPHSPHPSQAQHQTNTTSERHPRKSSRDNREDVFTFLPYSGKCHQSKVFSLVSSFHIIRDR